MKLSELIQDLIAGAAIIAEVDADQSILDAGQPVNFGPLQIGTRHGKPIKINGTITEG